MNSQDREEEKYLNLKSDSMGRKFKPVPLLMCLDHIAMSNEQVFNFNVYIIMNSQGTFLVLGL